MIVSCLVWQAALGSMSVAFALAMLAYRGAAGRASSESDDAALQVPHTSTTYFGEGHAFTVDEYDDGETRIS